MYYYVNGLSATKVKIKHKSEWLHSAQTADNSERGEVEDCHWYIADIIHQTYKRREQENHLNQLMFLAIDNP